MNANPGKNIEIEITATTADGRKTGVVTYLRLPIKTDLVTDKDNIFDLIEKYVKPHLVAGDIIFISEKVLAITQGRIIPIKDVKPRRLARFLAKKVDNKYGTPEFRGFGHGTAMGMELLVQEAGYPRTIFAAGVAALTKPFGIKGAFYLLVGKKAKSVDCPMSFTMYPFNHYAKLAPLDSPGVARQIRQRFDAETVIVDANYRGVVALGISSRAVKENFVKQVFRDNPLGQSEEFTPLCIVRKK
jgi:hypothetical protein